MPTQPHAQGRHQPQAGINERLERQETPLRPLLIEQQGRGHQQQHVVVQHVRRDEECAADQDGTPGNAGGITAERPPYGRDRQGRRRELHAAGDGLGHPEREQVDIGRHHVVRQDLEHVLQHARPAGGARLLDKVDPGLHAEHGRTRKHEHDDRRRRCKQRPPLPGRDQRDRDQQADLRLVGEQAEQHAGGHRRALEQAQATVHQRHIEERALPRQHDVHRRRRGRRRQPQPGTIAALDRRGANGDGHEHGKGAIDSHPGKRQQQQQPERRIEEWPEIDDVGEAVGVDRVLVLGELVDVSVDHRQLALEPGTQRRVRRQEVRVEHPLRLHEAVAAQELRGDHEHVVKSDHDAERNGQP